MALHIQRIRLQRFLVEEMTDPAKDPDPQDLQNSSAMAFFERLGGKIFSTDDLDLLDEYPRSIRRNYLMRRRALALRWLSEGRRRIGHIMRLHRRTARADSALKPREEFLLLAYCIFSQVLYCAAHVVALLAGPFALRGLVEQLAACQRRISGLLDGALPGDRRPVSQAL
jgi:hypothetical protein